MCIFCKIVKGEIPSKVILENEEFLAFNDINPAKKIHILVIPKKHYETFQLTPYNIMSDMSKFIQDVAKKLNIDKTGYRLITNNGQDGGQEVGHLHFHILGGENVGRLVSR